MVMCANSEKSHDNRCKPFRDEFAQRLHSLFSCSENFEKPGHTMCHGIRFCAHAHMAESHAFITTTRAIHALCTIIELQSQHDTTRHIDPPRFVSLRDPSNHVASDPIGGVRLPSTVLFLIRAMAMAMPLHAIQTIRPSRRTCCRGHMYPQTVTSRPIVSFFFPHSVSKYTYPHYSTHPRPLQRSPRPSTARLLSFCPNPFPNRSLTLASILCP